jgi:mannose-6-phosphate isomerase-like protein (cupin superfamily)
MQESDDRHTRENPRRNAGHSRSFRETKFMQALVILSLLALSAAGLPAQAQSEVMYDNEHVRVSKIVLQPHQPTPLQQHSKHRVLVCLDGGQMTTTAAGGKVEKLELNNGEVRWAPAGGSFVSENTGGQALQFIEIEPKGKQQPQVTVPDLDPLKVDPKHYNLELENDYTRVVRVRFGPLENGVVHTHVRNYLVVYMTNQAKGDRGEVRLHLDEGATTHTENNPLNQAVERIAVELK